MSALQPYCLDANVLIQAWQKYYSPRICSTYWEMLESLGQEGRVFLPQMVFEEVRRTEDDLAKWLVGCKIPVHPIDGPVTQCLQRMYAANPLHKYLVDNIKQRSLADPWVVAHAMNAGAHVVTKEDFIFPPDSTRLRIPNVCENMGIRWMNDFDFLAEVGLFFTCSIQQRATV